MGNELKMGNEIDSLNYCVIEKHTVPSDYFSEGISTGGGFDYVMYSKQINENIFVVGESHFDEPERGVLFFLFEKTEEAMKEIIAHNYDEPTVDWKDGFFIMAVIEYLISTYKPYEIMDLKGQAFFG